MGNCARTNMPSVMMLISAAVLLAISLDYANADCRLPADVSVGGALVAAMGQYTVMSTAGTGTCAAACVACGQTNPTADGTAGFGPTTAAEVTAIGTSICPTMAYTAVVMAAGTNCPFLGVGTAITVATGPTNRDTATGEVGTDVVANGVSALTSAGGFLLDTAVTECRSLAAVATKAYICPCEGPVPQTAPTACQTCGCTDLGVPTAAPTAIPSTAPTSVTGSPTASSPSVSSSSDDSLSGGAIAGIVIGSVVGAALVIGAGVMIGSK